MSTKRTIEQFMTVSTDQTETQLSEAVGQLADAVKGLIIKKNVAEQERDEAKQQSGQLLSLNQEALQKVHELIDVASAATAAE